MAFAAPVATETDLGSLILKVNHAGENGAIFWAELQARGRPRCRSYLLCGLGGLVLGFVTGLLGRSAMAATAVAVERVVLRHLHDQIAVLRDSDPSATQAIRSILAEEQQHHDQSAVHLPTHGFWLRVLQPVVSLSTEAVIWAGMKL